MPAADPCDADLLLVSAIHGSTQLGIVTGFQFGLAADLAKIRGEGVKGPSCIGVKANDYVVVVEFLVAPPVAVNGAAASLVIVTKKMDGTTSRTHTWVTMRTFEYAREFDRENPEGGRWRQPFIYEGALASDPLTIT